MPPTPRVLQELQNILLTEMPITQHFGVQVAEYDGQCLTLTAPLALNVNHQGTAFGGSLYAIATLAGWGLLWLLVREKDLPAHAVIQDATIRYLRPVGGNFTARACRPDLRSLIEAEATFRKRGRARVQLAVEIDDGQAVVVSFTGRYVLQR